MAKSRKSASQAASKWRTRIGQSAGAYTSGVTNATNWAENATSKAASELRNANLIAAINSGAIDSGIKKAGDAKWKANTLAKGAPAWTAAANTQAAQNAYQAAMTTVESDYGKADTAMAAAGDGSTTANRIQRAAAWATAMHQAKIDRGGRA